MATSPRPAFQEPLALMKLSLSPYVYSRYKWGELDFWYSRLESLEKRREYYNKKAAWSAKDVVEVDSIDNYINECIDIIDEYEDGMFYEDRIEWEYD